jgi:hypothetical protein
LSPVARRPMAQFFAETRGSPREPSVPHASSQPDAEAARKSTQSSPSRDKGH